MIDYRKFHADLIADLVLYYCHEAQEVLKHNKVLGVFFGYIMELMNERIWNAGHLAIDKVYRSTDIDLIATPSSYQFREYNDASSYMLLCDTLELNGKMYFASFDHMTFKVPELDNEKRRICGDNEVMKTMSQMSICRKDLLATRQQTLHGIQREFMQRLARHTGMWWFDMLEGWFYDEEIMENIGEIVAKSAKLLEKEWHSTSEIAVFVSCESLYYVNKCSKINTELICNQRGTLARMGAPYDLYSLNDMDRVPLDKYRLFIFLDAYYLTGEQRAYIEKSVKKDGRSLLFVGAPDYVDDSGFSKERMEQMTEMKLELLEKDEATINACDSIYGYSSPKNPTWYIADTDVRIIGRFTSSRLCGLAGKQSQDYTVYFSGVGNLSASVLREIARQSGVHIYAEYDTPVFVHSGFVGVYNTRNEITRITLPYDGEFEELFSGKRYQSVQGVSLITFVQIIHQISYQHTFSKLR